MHLWAHDPRSAYDMSTSRNLCSPDNDYLSPCPQLSSVYPKTRNFQNKFVFVFHSSVAATQMSERMMSPVVYKQLIQVQLIHCGRAFASKRKQRSHRCALATTSHQRIKFYWQLTNASVQWQICQFQSQERSWSAPTERIKKAGQHFDFLCPSHNWLLWLGDVNFVKVDTQT